MESNTDILFALLRGAIEGRKIVLSSQIETSRWWHLFRLAQQNHVAVMTADTMATLDVPREVKIPWLSERDKAVRWHLYQSEVQQEIVSAMKQRGIETLVLKGTHTAQYYPIPETREFGDLDLYFYDKHDEADRVAREVLKVSVSNEAHHHSKYNYRGVTVESHYDFLNTHYPPSNRHYETLLKQLATNSSPTFEVLFLLRHMACHFAASRITLRDLVDWTLTCRALEDKVDWVLAEKTIKDYGMTDFVVVLCTIAERRLGVQQNTLSLPHSSTLPLIEKDIVYGSVDDHDANGVSRLLWKMRRWNALAWKRQMVYNDSPFSLLLSSLMSHTMKPQSILHKQ